MRSGLRAFPQGFPCPVVLWILPRRLKLRIRGSHPLWPAVPKPFSCPSRIAYAVRTPAWFQAGLGSSPFARRYLGNRCFFLFLRVLRCFSSPGSPPPPMDSATDGRSFYGRVSPFRNPRIHGYVLLPGAFRSLSRLSSALSAKASALRPFLLDLFVPGLPFWKSRLPPGLPSVGAGQPATDLSMAFFLAFVLGSLCSALQRNMMSFFFGNLFRKTFLLCAVFKVRPAF